MLLLSVSPQHHTLFSVPRVSSSSSLSSSSRLPLLPKLTSSIFSRSTARRFPCALTFASKVRSMAELVEDKEAGVAVVASGSGEGTEESKGLNRSHTFLDARTEEVMGNLPRRRISDSSVRAFLLMLVLRRQGNMSICLPLVAEK
ncbi:hypothetical protein CK203_061847 [Vitis vinifera]|uniref:Uncharacterized protein n=1 Tax=Vitis vinifera TaxID=29760 RepID=A0A438GC12_VITVI|nr:hypothetical protein CK203_061847 [Vitis vinifera]